MNLQSSTHPHPPLPPPPPRLIYMSPPPSRCKHFYLFSGFSRLLSRTPFFSQISPPGASAYGCEPPDMGLPWPHVPPFFLKRSAETRLKHPCRKIVSASCSWCRRHTHTHTEQNEYILQTAPWWKSGILWFTPQFSHRISSQPHAV